MGCPDWPRCFGLWAPPTCDCDLPANYEQIFLEKRLAKVQRFSQTLERLGLTQQAKTLRENPYVDLPEKFDPVKAWIEYINRLFGVLSGFAATAFLFFAFRHRAFSAQRIWVVLGFVLLLINAWLGSIVVASNLLPGIVSLHYLLAFACLFSFMMALHKQRHFHWPGFRSHSMLQWGLFLGTMAVVLLGTWTREQVDVLRLNGILSDGGHLNMADMDNLFIVHRYLPVLLAFWVVMHLRKLPGESLGTSEFPYLLFVVISLLQIGLGAIHIWFLVPTWTQLFHVVLGSSLPVLAFYLALQHSNSETR
jgi:cytochrome c oxidase assembly protein subunit 15